MVAPNVRPLTFDGTEEVLDLSEQRRERILVFAPLFWRPAPDARDRHRVLAFHVDGGPALTELESAAASSGAGVSVVPRKPQQPTDLLTSAGYKKTTDSFVWHR